MLRDLEFFVSWPEVKPNKVKKLSKTIIVVETKNAIFSNLGDVRKDHLNL